ncbi:MAG: hypothetical protein MJ231_02795 [bacterium]|nr:hypothetical protein [bacterium]
MKCVASYNPYTYKNSDIMYPSFKGKHKKTDNGNTYYHTNTGLCVGAVCCALLTGIFGIASKSSKFALRTLLVSSPLILMGVTSDKIRNKENMKSADLVAKHGIEKTSEIDPNVCLSQNNNPYKKSLSGTRVGCVVSLVFATALFGFLTRKSIKSGKSIKEALKDSIKEIAEETFIDDTILGGPFIPFTLGMGIDFLANKNAQRNA